MIKPECKLIGENITIFNLMSVANKTLKKHGMQEQAKQMLHLVTKAESYEEALMIIDEYVDIKLNGGCNI